ncbi:Dus-domain-containing protein [Sistotremastrum niveocremeum HHB9708]|uniref:tRNA-dihydrouridine(16/17) synthase [NAD(P)(+)] n=1 Tax=Sistotremastrum niveocremeum HHB9708 TaxID=1314777 RepID=A0A164US61_9AGAM|nr:Dus-domain-containing protein [Sistotremastrum niveocremeum HHB9708]
MTSRAGSSRKLQGYDFYKQVLGSPKYIVGPMVDQSELAWRILSRRYGTELVYSPMIPAKTFVEAKKRRDCNFDLRNGEEGGPEDRPLIVQFCANDPAILLKAAQLVQGQCDAVDINFGCPQDVARRGQYGCFLQDDWDKIYSLINTLHTNLDIPVTAKFRVFPTVEKTVEYAKMMERAGAQILTCHGRLREQKGQFSGLADWEKIRAVKQAVSVPVFANGNILFHSDVDKCLEFTGCDGVMSAEGNLYNPALFSGKNPEHAELALEYLEIVKSLKTKTQTSAVKGHMFKVMRPGLAVHTDLRDRLGKIRGDLTEFEDVALEMRTRMKRDQEAAEGQSIESLTKIDEATGLPVLPHWLAQPYFRPIQVRPQPPAAPTKTSRSLICKFVSELM